MFTHIRKWVADLPFLYNVQSRINKKYNTINIWIHSKVIWRIEMMKRVRVYIYIIDIIIIISIIIIIIYLISISTGIGQIISPQFIASSAAITSCLRVVAVSRHFNLSTAIWGYITFRTLFILKGENINMHWNMSVWTTSFVMCCENFY